MCLAIRYLQFAQFSTLPHEQTASEGGRGEGLWQWLAGEQTIYMAQVSSVLLTALKSDRRSDGWTSPSVLPPCLSACLTFRRWTSWEFRFDIRNLFENYIAFHAPTIVFVYK